MDGDVGSEMPSPKRVRLESSEIETSHNKAPRVDCMDELFGSLQRNEENSKGNQGMDTPMQNNPLGSASLNPSTLPGLGSLDGDLNLSKETGQSRPQDHPVIGIDSNTNSEQKQPVVHIASSEMPMSTDEHESMSQSATVDATPGTIGPELVTSFNNDPKPPSLVQDRTDNVDNPELHIDATTGERQPDEKLNDANLGKAEAEINVEIPESKVPDTEEASLGVTDSSTGPENPSRTVMVELDVRNVGDGKGNVIQESPSIDEDVMRSVTATQTSEELIKANKPSEDAEFEIDSSPYQSSSSDISTDTSSSDSDNDSNADDYEMLSPAEEARRLMAEDGGQEDKATTGVPRTLNEKPDEIVPLPNVDITTDMDLEELGHVENLVENLALIKAKTSGEYHVLEAGSVLCLEDRKVIGVVAETLGQVRQPFYTVRFTNPAAILEAGVTQSTKVFYVAQFATIVLTQGLQAIKGSDASNLHDEEAADDELEFSDDEAEAEHKRQVKLQKRARHDARHGQGDGFSRGPQNRPGKVESKTRLPSHPENLPGMTEPALNYDDAGEDSDELYTPLARPSNLHEMMARKDGPPGGSANHGNAPRGGRGRGRGDRGDGRGRGRGGRGNGRAQNHDRQGRNGSRGDGHSHAHPNAGSNHTSGARSNVSNPIPAHSLPPRPSPQTNGFHSHPQSQHSPMPASSFPAHSSPQPQPQSHPSYPSQHPPSYNQTYPQQYQQSQYPQAHYPQGMPHQSYFSQQAFSPSMQYPVQQTPLTPTSPAIIPPGAHINPNFFRQQAQNPPQSWQQWQGQPPSSSAHQQYQQYQQPSPASSNPGPLGSMSPDAARRLQENLSRLNGMNGTGGAGS